MITIVASAIFLLCIMLLKVDERRRDVAALRLIGSRRARSSAAWCSRRRLVAVLGSLAGVGVGGAASWIVNRHYQAVYRTPLRFSIVTADIVAHRRRAVARAGDRGRLARGAATRARRRRSCCSVADG